MREFTLEDFDYYLPKELIAQEHVVPRHNSRLLVVKDKLYHKHFYDLPEFLNKGDVIVVNNTRVIPARFFGRKETGGKVELLLIRRVDDDSWEAMIRGKNIREGTELLFDGFKVKVVNKENGKFIIKLDNEMDEEELLSKGRMPLPPYIKKKLEDQEMYQTIYSKKKGAIAAPTAGLHFTQELIDKIKKKGIDFVEITLHVSLGTFKPVHDLKNHKMDPEYYEVSEESALRINKAFNSGKQVFAVGTTVVKTLETVADENGLVRAGVGLSDLFIKPGYEFKTKLTGMITNFHLPKSTLIMMVTAFGGYERVMNAYKEAIRLKYRFYSFGDAMLLFKFTNHEQKVYKS